MDKNEVDITKTISEEIEKIKFLADEAGCKINLQITGKIPVIKVDENEIKRVFQNILTNAIDFAPENTSVDVTISFAKSKFLVAITDKGPGISPENLPYVFDRYFTASKKYRKVGTGLGLYLSKKIVDLHGGDIKVKSIPNKETTFTIILP